MNPDHPYYRHLESTDRAAAYLLEGRTHIPAHVVTPETEKNLPADVIERWKGGPPPKPDTAEKKPKGKPKAKAPAEPTGRGADLVAIARENAGDNPDPVSLAKDLVNAWLGGHRSGYSPDELAPVEAELRKAGAEPVGAAGQTVPADPSRHKPETGNVSTGSPVRVVRPGWVVRTPDGRELLLAPAVVERTS